MGGDDSKPEKQPEKLPEKQPDKEKPKRRSPVASPRNLRNSQMDIYLQKGPTNNKIPSRRSPDSKLDKGNSKDPTRSPTKLSNRGSPLKNRQSSMHNENQFMPLMNWPDTGAIKLKIKLVQFVFSQSQPGLIRNSSSYSANLSWKKLNNRNFQFILKEEPSTTVKLQIDLQGEVVSGDEQFWMALSPVSIPFAKSIKVGNFKCVNIFQYQTQDDAYEVNEGGPSTWNIDFPIPEQAFQRWGEPIPSSNYNEGKSNKNKRMFENYIQYEQTSRYFDESNNWQASTYVHKNDDSHRSWLIELNDADPKLSRQLHKDLQTRQKYYVEEIYRKNN